MSKDLYVSEHFGPTFQGEGQDLGLRVAFLRLAGCNLTCDWCDTKYTWDFINNQKDVTRMSSDDVVKALLKYDVNQYVISGGEPMLQQEALKPVVGKLTEHYRRVVSFETNGTILPEVFFLGSLVDFTVSPKLTHAKTKPLPVNVQAWSDFDPVWKFVCQQPSDLDEVAQFNTPKASTWIMPEGVTPEQILHNTRLLAQPTLDRGWNLTTRLHTLIWGSERAR